MLISLAIRSLTVAVGVGFLLNSASSVTNCSWVARWRFWFFCCWVRVDFRAGRLEPEVTPELGGDGEGVRDVLMVSFISEANEVSKYTDILLMDALWIPRWDIEGNGF
jgi:hypothetical protein